ncbi:MAG: Gfo/Idh/MocA family protein [Armatimonadota bacterium]
MSKLRGALIGCGFFARNHLHGWAEVEAAAIVATCDVDRSRAEAYAREFGIAAAYADPAEMLVRERLDFVDIVTQPGTHRELTELAASRGVHVICQKPMAPSLEEARSMVAACRAAGVRFMVHENFRWQRPMRELKQASEELGELFFGRITWRTPFDIYHYQPYLAEDPRFIIADLGVHLLDLARFFLGEVEQLYCVTRRVNPRIQGEDVATILLKMRSGAACVVEASYASPLEDDPFPQTLVYLEGSEKTAILSPGFELTVTRPGETVRRDVSPPLLSWASPPAHAIQESIPSLQRHWVECLREGREPETSGVDNLRTLELVYGAYESAETARAVNPHGEQTR